MGLEIKLTGRTRARVLHRYFRPDVLVMQVEETRKGYIDDGWGDRDYVEDTYWRDAVVEDFVSPYALEEISC